MYLGYFILAINSLLFLRNFKKNTFEVKVFSLYLLFSLIIQLSSGFIAKLGNNNIYLFHLFNVGQYFFLSLFYSKQTKNKLLKKSVFWGIRIIPFSILFFYVFNPDYIFKFNTIEILICYIPLLIYSFYFLIERIDEVDKKFIYFNASFLIYTFCSTLLFSTGNIQSEIKSLIWDFNIYLYLIYQIFIFIEWYKNFRKPISFT